MWVFTTSGFLSAVEERRGEHRGEIVVRAREASALEALREVAPTLSEVVIYSDSDYRYRAWLSHEEWAQALAELGRRISYSNYKSAVLQRQGRTRFEEALHEVWEALGRTQPAAPTGLEEPAARRSRTASGQPRVADVSAGPHSVVVSGSRIRAASLDELRGRPGKTPPRTLLRVSRFALAHQGDLCCPSARVRTRIQDGRNPIQFSEQLSVHTSCRSHHVAVQE